MKKDKKIEEVFNDYKARVVEMDDTPNMICGSLGKFKMLPIEEYDELQSKIADLEAKLAESETESNARYSAWQEEIRSCDELRVVLAEKDDELNNLSQMCLICNKDQENEKLREQLAEKDKEVEKLKTTNDRLYKKNKKLENQIVESNIRFYKKGGVEQLEKVKELVDLEYGHINIIDTIDNQIKHLKGVKNE